MDAMREHQVEMALVPPSPDLYYLTGVQRKPSERFLALLLRPDAPPTFLLPRLEEEWVRSVCPEIATIAWREDEDPYAALAAWADAHGFAGGRVLLGDKMWAVQAHHAMSAFFGADSAPLSTLLDPLRMRKDEGEVRLLKEACRVNDAVYAEALGKLHRGVTEAAIARFILRRFLESGLDDGWVIVAFGENAARPHHAPGERALRRGDVVLIDMGGSFRGYNTDMTRTVAFGAADRDVRDVYELVRSTQAAGVRAATPGTTTGDIDRLTHHLIAEHGHGDAYFHRTGHGIGLEVHEAPYLVTVDETVLEPGMAFTVEPGIYLEGRFGVRVEDTVVLTEDGPRALTRTSRAFRTVG
jgi:Xaa-Pro aminopeptidase